MIPNEFRTMLFGLGAQRLTLDKLGIQYLHSQSRFRTFQVKRSGSCSATRASHLISSLFACHPRFLFRCYSLHRNIYYTTILVHRRTVHMWRWFHGLMSLIITRPRPKTAFFFSSCDFALWTLIGSQPGDTDTAAKRIVHARPHSSRVISARPPSV